MNKFASAPAALVARFLITSASQGLPWTAQAESAKLRLRELASNPPQRGIPSQDAVHLLSCAIVFPDTSDLALGLLSHIRADALTLSEFSKLLHHCAKYGKAMKDEDMRILMKACPLSDLRAFVEMLVQLHQAQQWGILHLALDTVLPQIHPLKFTDTDDLAMLLQCSLAASAQLRCMPLVLRSPLWASRIVSATFAWEYSRAVALFCAIRPVHITNDTLSYLCMILHRITTDAHKLSIENALEICGTMAKLTPDHLRNFSPQRVLQDLGATLQRIIAARGVTVPAVTLESALSVFQAFALLRCKCSAETMKSLQRFVGNAEALVLLNEVQHWDFVRALVSLLRWESHEQSASELLLNLLPSSPPRDPLSIVEAVTLIVFEVAEWQQDRAMKEEPPSQFAFRQRLLRSCWYVFCLEDICGRSVETLAAAVYVAVELSLPPQDVATLNREAAAMIEDVVKEIDGWDHRRSITQGFYECWRRGVSILPHETYVAVANRVRCPV